METKASTVAAKPLTNGHPKPTADVHWLSLVERQVEALKFGSVLITVHEGRVVQVETSVRVRFDK